MQATRFELRIELGNAAMFGSADVADALRGLADRIEREDVESGTVLDANGNTVGEWRFS